MWTDLQFCHLRGCCAPEIVNTEIFEPDDVPCAGERPCRCMGIHRPLTNGAWKKPLGFSRKLLGLSDELEGKRGKWNAVRLTVLCPLAGDCPERRCVIEGQFR